MATATAKAASSTSLGSASWHISSPSMKISSPGVVTRRTRDVGATGRRDAKSRGRRTASRSRSRSVVKRQQEQLTKSTTKAAVPTEKSNRIKDSPEKPHRRRPRSSSRSMQSSSHSTLASSVSGSRPSTSTSNSSSKNGGKKSSRSHSLLTATATEASHKSGGGPRHLHASLSALYSVPDHHHHNKHHHNSTGFHLPASLQHHPPHRSSDSTSDGSNLAVSSRSEVSSLDDRRSISATSTTGLPRRINSLNSTRPKNNQPLSAGDRFNQSLSSLRADRRRTRSTSRSRTTNPTGRLSLTGSSHHTTQSQQVSRRSATRERLREGRSRDRSRSQQRQQGTSFPRNPSRSRSRTPGGLDGSYHYQLRVERHQSVKALLMNDESEEGDGSLQEDSVLNMSNTSMSMSGSSSRLSSMSGSSSRLSQTNGGAGYVSLREKRRQSLDQKAKNAGANNSSAPLTSSSTHSTNSHQSRSSTSRRRRRTSADTTRKMEELLQDTTTDNSTGPSSNEKLLRRSNHSTTRRLSSSSKLGKTASERDLYGQHDSMDAEHHRHNATVASKRSREAAHLYLHASASEVLATSFGELCLHSATGSSSHNSTTLGDAPVPSSKSTPTTSQQRRLNASLNAEMFLQRSPDSRSMQTELKQQSCPTKTSGRRSKPEWLTLSQTPARPNSSSSSDQRRSSIPTFQSSGLDDLDDGIDSDDDANDENDTLQAITKERHVHSPPLARSNSSRHNSASGGESGFEQSLTSDFSTPIRSMLGDGFGILTSDDDIDDLDMDILQLMEEENDDGYDNMGNSQKLDLMASSFSDLDSCTPSWDQKEVVDLTIVKDNNKSVSSGRTLSTCRSSLSGGTKLSSPLSPNTFAVRSLEESPPSLSSQRLDKSSPKGEAFSTSKILRSATSKVSKRKSSSRKSTTKNECKPTRTSVKHLKDSAAPITSNSSRRNSAVSKSSTPTSTRRRRASASIISDKTASASSISTLRRRSDSKKTSS